jgi:hypothetical protein
MRKVFNIQPLKTDAEGKLEISGNTEKDNEGRWYVRADSRPKKWDICFTGAGDDIQNNGIASGKEFSWDFSNNDDLDPSPPSGYKRKIIQFQFMDDIKIKEGTVYFYDIPKGCYMDFYIVCPPGGYYGRKYLDENNDLQIQIAQATEYIKFARWIAHYRITGSAPMGDELNTEAADEDLVPSYMLWQIEITTPDTDSSSYGHFILEIYRARTVYFEPLV